MDFFNFFLKMNRIQSSPFFFSPGDVEIFSFLVIDTFHAKYEILQLAKISQTYFNQVTPKLLQKRLEFVPYGT